MAANRVAGAVNPRSCGSARLQGETEGQSTNSGVRDEEEEEEAGIRTVFERG